MLIDDSLFLQEFSKIGVHQAPVFWEYSGEFIADKSRISVHNILTINRVSKYASSIADYIFVTVEMYKTEYFKLLQINKRNLKFNLIKTSTNTSGISVKLGATYNEIYNAHLHDPKSEAIETRSGQLTGTHLDDLGALVEVDLQLVEIGLAEFRLWEVGGVYHHVTVGELIQGMMSHPMKTLGEGKPTGYNVTIIPPDNKDRQYQIVVPNGIRLVDLPAWVQNSGWGVYSSGIGYYLSKAMWYIFPLFDISLYKRAKKRITIINVPKNEMLGITNSYNLTDNELYIYTTGDTTHVDPSDRLLDQSGTGIRAAKVGNLLSKFTTSIEGNTKVPNGRNMMAISFETREGELDNIKAPSGLFTSNVYAEASKVIGNMGNYVKVTWESSNPNLIYPGMPVKFIYKYRGIPYCLFGLVHAVESMTKTHLQSIADKRYATLSEITIFCERATR